MLLTIGTDAITSVMTSRIVRRYALFANDENGEIINATYNQLYEGSYYTIAEWSQIQVAAGVAFMVGIWQVSITE